MKNKYIFISPHLDDAILSCGGLIKYLSGIAEVSVITVFTEAGNNKTVTTWRILRKCGFANASEYYKARRREDQRVLKKLGVRAVHLGFIDAPWRGYYPLFRWQGYTGKISQEDKSLLIKIKEKRRKYTAGNKMVFGPMAFGKHVDHVMVHEACKEFQNVIFWEDVPYKNQENKLFKKMSINVNEEEKLQLIKEYKTQYKTLFDEELKIKLKEESYYITDRHCEEVLRRGNLYK